MSSKYLEKVSSKFLDLFHIPTWCYWFIAIASTFAICGNLYMYLQIDALESIVVEGIRYERETIEYAKGIKEIKISMVLSGLLAVGAAIFSFYKINRRKNKLS